MIFKVENGPAQSLVLPQDLGSRGPCHARDRRALAAGHDREAPKRAFGREGVRTGWQPRIPCPNYCIVCQID